MDDSTATPFQYSIPPEADDSASTNPLFQYSIPADTFNPVQAGIGVGSKVALALAGLYAIGVALFFVITEWDVIPSEDLRDFWMVAGAIANIYAGTAMVAGVAVVFGGIPAVIIGAIGGGVIGYTFRFIKKPLSTPQAIHYGFWISLFLLVVRIGVLAGVNGFDALGDSLHDGMMWMVWYAPNLIAFFGFWWVAYKLNEKLPTPSP